MQSYTYSPSNVSLIVAGYRVVGWEKIVVRRQAPTFKVVKGIRGKNTRIRNKNSLTEVRVTVNQTSPANSVFNTIALEDFNTGNGLLSINLKDPSGSDFLHSNEAFLEGYSEVTLSGDSTDREWIFHCLSLSNTSGSGDIQSKLGSIFSKFF